MQYFLFMMKKGLSMDTADNYYVQIICIFLFQFYFNTIEPENTAYNLSK